MKNILIINAHPDKESLCTELALNYQSGAEAAGARCKLVHLTDLQFDPILRQGYRQVMPLEPDLLKMQQDLFAADHLVMVYPNWWGTYPALLKGFIDRMFLPGFAFKFKEKSVFQEKLLTDKTARLIVTMDTPAWYYSLIYKQPGHRSMKKGILEFAGIKPVKITSFSPVKSATPQQRSKWLAKVNKLGFNQN